MHWIVDAVPPPLLTPRTSLHRLTIVLFRYVYFCVEHFVCWFYFANRQTKISFLFESTVLPKALNMYIAIAIDPDNLRNTYHDTAILTLFYIRLKRFDYTTKISILCSQPLFSNRKLGSIHTLTGFSLLYNKCNEKNKQNLMRELYTRDSYKWHAKRFTFVLFSKSKRESESQQKDNITLSSVHEQTMLRLTIVYGLWCWCGDYARYRTTIKKAYTIH